MATYLNEPDADAFAPPGGSDAAIELAQLENPFAGLLAFANRRRRRREQDTYLSQLNAANAQEALLQGQGQAIDLIKGTRDRDPLAAANTELMLSSIAPDVFGEGPSDAGQALLEQEAAGFAALPGSNVFKNVGAGAENFAGAGILFPRNNTVNELVTGNVQGLFDAGSTPGGRSRSSGGGSSKDKLVVRVPVLDATGQNILAYSDQTFYGPTAREQAEAVVRANTPAGTMPQMPPVETIGDINDPLPVVSGAGSADIEETSSTGMSDEDVINLTVQTFGPDASPQIGTAPNGQRYVEYTDPAIPGDRQRVPVD